MKVTCSVPEAGQILDLSRGSSYEAAKRGDIPVIRVGERMRVSITQFEKQHGFDPGELDCLREEPADTQAA
jgi:hypothetical protein